MSDKIKFINRIYNKFNGEIPAKVIDDVLKISLNHIIDEVKAGRQYSIDGLGMFSLVYFYNKKRFLFKPHYIFNFLLQRKLNMFKKTKK